jgi:hypothetical protein
MRALVRVVQRADARAWAAMSPEERAALAAEAEVVDGVSPGALASYVPMAVAGGAAPSPSLVGEPLRMGLPVAYSDDGAGVGFALVEEEPSAETMRQLAARATLARFEKAERDRVPVAAAAAAKARAIPNLNPNPNLNPSVGEAALELRAKEMGLAALMSALIKLGVALPSGRQLRGFYSDLWVRTMAAKAAALVPPAIYASPAQSMAPPGLRQHRVPMCGLAGCERPCYGDERGGYLDFCSKTCARAAGAMEPQSADVAAAQGAAKAAEVAMAAQVARMALLEKENRVLRAARQE